MASKSRNRRNSAGWSSEVIVNVGKVALYNFAHVVDQHELLYMNSFNRIT